MTSRWQLSPSGKMISVLKSLFSVGHLSAAVIDQTCALNCVAPRKSLRFAAIHLLWWAKHPPIGGRLLRCDHVYHGIPTRWSRKEPTDDRQADGLIMADEIKLPRNMTRIEIDRELRHLETIDHGRDIARYQALRQALAEKLTKNAISMHCDRKIKTISRVTNLMRQKMAADAAERLEEQQRIRAGWQCPECYGRARIQARTSPFQPNNGFLCRMRMPMAQPMTREPTFRWVCSYQGCVDCLRTIEIGRFRWAGETR